MNSATQPDMRDVHDQAEDWFARLRAPDCRKEDRIACRQWLEDPHNRAAYREVKRVWECTAALQMSPEIAQATEMAMRGSASHYNVPRRRWRIPAAAAAVAMLALALSPLTPWGQRGNHYETATGEQRRITLADGSKVLLDAESDLTVRYGERERTLVLKKGQAQFDVEKDPHRPFIVRAADGSVRAIGTAFQVRVIGNEVLVTLLEGKVAVDVPSITPAAQPETLIAGEQVAYSTRKSVFRKQEADLEVAKGWTYGDLVFKRWRLDDLVAEMNRYSITKLVIEDPSLGGLVVSGRFHAGDHESLILALESDWPVRATTGVGGEVALYRR